MHAPRISRRFLIRLVAGCALAAMLPGAPAPAAPAGGGIRPLGGNPWYWQYKGKPVLLLGGSKDDNLFQLPDLKAHLDEIHAAGGNYIRNTMSDRRNKGFEVYPFRKLSGGKYDLRLWNDEYWKRFENLLRWTSERDIIVQIEVWDRFDYGDQREPNWKNHPYNPRNNVNYTEAESGLKPTYKKHPGANEQPFFFTVPALQNNKVVLKYQQAFVDKLLSHSLKYGNVLYCMDNETNGREEWGAYWAKYIRRRAKEAGVAAQVTEMWDAWNLKKSEHRRTFDHPETYTFVDISQNNHNTGQVHWDNLQWVREHLSKRPRPMNCVKIYGADTGRYGKDRDGLERFWRNIFGGAASSRFHRPTSGLGLGKKAKAHIKSLRLLAADFDFFRAVPDAASQLLSDRKPNEAYLSYIRGSLFALYFPDGGSVLLDPSGVSGTVSIRWLDIARSRWNRATVEPCKEKLRLTAPGKGHWACLVRKK